MASEKRCHDFQEQHELNFLKIFKHIYKSQINQDVAMQQLDSDSVHCRLLNTSDKRSTNINDVEGTITKNPH